MESLFYLIKLTKIAMMVDVMIYPYLNKIITP